MRGYLCSSADGSNALSGDVLRDKKSAGHSSNVKACGEKEVVYPSSLSGEIESSDTGVEGSYVRWVGRSWKAIVKCCATSLQVSYDVLGNAVKKD